jgi:cytochrome c-type biogenesis protein CcmH
MTEAYERPLPRIAMRLLAPLALGLAAVLALALVGTDRAGAQPPPTEAQALAIERQLMCPQCPNERLDTCTRAVCLDMKRSIRDQLADGRTPDDIILFFETRYGPRVRASLEPAGFNLLLYGWIGVAMLAVVGGGTWYLWTLRRRSLAVAGASASTADTADDAWLDEQLAGSDEPPEGGR